MHGGETDKNTKQNKAEPPVYIISSGRRVFWRIFESLCFAQCGSPRSSGALDEIEFFFSDAVSPIYSTHVEQCIYKAWVISTETH